MQRRLPPFGPPENPRPISVPQPLKTSGVSELFAVLGGARFEEGAYRIHDPACAGQWTALAVAAFPDTAGNVLCFASDWLGRQFAVSTEPAPNGQPGVLLLDVQSDDVLHTDRDLEEFHDGLLADDPEPALALQLYGRWRAAGGAIPNAKQCVEYTVPIYLGGADDLSNMSITDMEVAWHIGGQLLAKVRGLPEGTRISGIDTA